MSDTPAGLERAPVVGGSVRDDQFALSKRCLDELGYKGPQLEEMRKQQDENKAASIFSKLGIEPFTEESVQRYQRTEFNKLRARQMTAWVRSSVLFFLVADFFRLAKRESWPGGWVSAMFYMVALFCSHALLLLMVFAPRDLTGTLPLGTVFWAALATMVVPRVAMSLIPGAQDRILRAIEEDNVLMSGIAGWRSHRLCGYEGYVPERVLETALRLNKAGVTALMVEELVVEEWVVDPFLIAKIGERRYYVDVWNEPDFQKTIG